MKYVEKEFFLVNTDKAPKHFSGDENNTYFITKKNGYVLKKIWHSNILLLHNQTTNTVSPINLLLEKNQNDVDFEQINAILPFSKQIYKDLHCLQATKKHSLSSFCEKLENNECFIISLNNLQNEYGYGDEQIVDIINKFKLFNLGNDAYIRYDYKIMRKILEVLYSLTVTNSRKDELLEFFPKYIIKDIMKWFSGNKEELCLYVILDLYETDKIENFEQVLKEMVIGIIDYKKIIILFNNMYHKEKKEVLEILENFIN